MDELLQHCTRELAFEGDLGCDVSRLRDFIADYHSQAHSPQNVDDAYCAFVWSVVAQQPEIQVGTAPEGDPEKYMVAQSDKRDKSKSKHKEEPPVLSPLTLIPDASLKSLDELKAEYGDALRIAVVPERSFIALTGSHIRPSMLTPTVYMCLQLIARSREAGLKSVLLSSKTGYDAKTCHYLIGKLVQLNLVVKRKSSGVGTNTCIHKYFFDRSETWQAILAKEQEVTKGIAAEDEQDDAAEEGDGIVGSIHLEPIDASHLSSLPIVRATLEQLLRNSPNRTHKLLNILVAIGFANPSKTDRRFFNARVRELVAEGFIETVQMLKKNGKYVKCIRLVDAEVGRSIQANEDHATPADADQENPPLSVKATITLQRQILDIVHATGTEGATLNQIADTLCHFDRRLLDFQVNRLRETLPPPHLRHMGLEQTAETYGRERRYKYYTHDHYMQVAEKEQLEQEKLDAMFPEGYFDLAHGFAPVDESQFYKDVSELDQFVDTFKSASGAEASGKTKKTPKLKKRTTTDGGQSKHVKKRKREETIGSESASASAPLKKRGRPLLEDTTVETTVGQESVSVPPTPKKRGRPRKHPLPDGVTADVIEGQESASVPKKRGRPRKHPLPEEGAATAPVVQKKRGRPRKHLLPDAVDVNGENETPPTVPQGSLLDDVSIAIAAPGPSASRPNDTVVASDSMDVPESGSVSAPMAKRRPGRPRKRLHETVAPDDVCTQGTSIESSVAPATGVLPDIATEPTEDSPVLEPISAPVKKRGRPRKYPLSGETSPMHPENVPSVVGGAGDGAQLSSTATPSVPKRRGRPPKPRTTLEVEVPQVASKRRGRPSKNRPQEQQEIIVEHEEQELIEDEGIAPPEHPHENAEPAGPSVDGRAFLPSASENASLPVLLPSNQIPMAVDVLPSSDIPLTTSVSGSASHITIDPSLLGAEGQTTAPPDVFFESVSTPVPSLDKQNKRPLPESTPELSVSKRPKTSGSANYRSRTNITQSRRQKEIMCVLDRLGGIANVSCKDLYDEHAAVVEALSEAGEPTSTIVGSTIDKRTLIATLDELESQGKIKSLKTELSSSTGVSRQVKVVYFTDTAQGTINEFLANLSFTHPAQTTSVPIPSIKIVEAPVEYGGNRSKKISRSSALTIPLDRPDKDHNPQQAEQLLQADEATIKASLLTEPNTVVQQYGFIVGKIARVRELHMHILRLMEERSSPSIVSAEQRIIQLSYFFQDLPVSVHAAVVTCRVHNEALLRLLATPEGRRTPLRELPPAIQEALEIGKARARTKMLDDLNLLECLGLVVPLRASEDEQAFVKCEPSGEHPSAFERTSCDSNATLVAPPYWMFNRSVPLFMWALDDSNPPLYRHASFNSPSEAEQSWEDLQKMSLDTSFCKKVLDERSTAGISEQQYPPATMPLSVMKLLRRPTQWSSTYNFSWFQKQYLRKYINIATTETPLEDKVDGESQLDRIASTVNAPRGQVEKFYEHERNKLIKDMKRIQKRKADKGRSAEETKASLVQKAAEAKAQRERDWEEILARVHPEPLKGTSASCVRGIRTRFMQSSGRDIQKWEAEVKNAIQEAIISATRSRPPLPQVPLHPLPPPPPLPLKSNEKSVEEIIALQGPVLEKKLSKKKTKGKGNGKSKGKGKEREQDDEEDEKQRRQRFQWNKSLDELACDAAAIIRARCRPEKRVQWAALEQVFPATTPNSVRQRLVHISAQAGQDTYMKRLEDRWYELWKRYLGASELPDDDPGSATNFDLIAHITFLRKHIDKNALRVGFLETEQPHVVAIPISIDALQDKWQVVEKPATTPSWDFVWTGPSEEGREKQLSQQSFVLGGNELPDTRQYTSDNIYVAGAALKMTLGTPTEAYDIDQGSLVLKSVGDDVIKAAARDLQEQGVVSLVVSDPKKSKPGRTLKISDPNQNALGGSIPEELFQDAVALDDLLSQEEDTSWREWPLLSSDGDIAGLIQLASDGKLDFKIDTSHAQTARSIVDWNSKKADDDDIESAISVRYRDMGAEQSASPAPEDVIMYEPRGSNLPEGAIHGKTADGELACCANTSAGIVDCAACLSIATVSLLQSIDPEETEIVRALLDALEDAGPEGLTKEELQTFVKRQIVQKLPACVARLTNANPPLALWAGYKQTVLVFSQYASAWSVIIDLREADCVRVLPRRWLNIRGIRMTDGWDAACRAAMGIILFHPGISQAELRWRLRAVYDRQELHEVLHKLLEDGFLERDVRSAGPLAGEGPPSNAEEKAILWSASHRKRWYQVDTVSVVMEH